MSHIELIRSREQQASKPRDERGRGLSPREVLLKRISARRSAH